MRTSSGSLLAIVLASAALLGGCTSGPMHSASERAAEQAEASSVPSSLASTVPSEQSPGPESSPPPVPEPWSSAAASDAISEAGAAEGGPVTGMPPAQPFGIVNNLPVAVKIVVADVDPYDWKVRDGYGRPDLSIPEGFTGIIKPGASTAGVFLPNYFASDAPFRLDVSSWTPANTEALTASQPIGSISFDKIYFCVFQVVQLPCSIVTSKEWYGWGYRVDDSKAVRNQVPQMCNTTRELGTYTYQREVRKARIRLECASTRALVIGNAAIIEDAPR